ncbi:peptidoglycan recognition protein family protein [Thaumasiovibrio subtropicus]|uniref:peptidoglycan recognition protein family protein n=1 Tax=Thaumasiovibrio subtropicus TaxID=1891207 RepID=UPI000B3640DC|nr:peptidoglycan recognition family protein [Thaumasiovibrio subtropicus]
MKVNKIIVHHSATSAVTTTVSSIKSGHLKGGKSDIGYHKVITWNGKIKEGRSEKVQGAHAKGANTNSLGVCLTGNFESESPSQAQKASLVELLTRWCKEHDLTVDKIYPHRSTPGAKTATLCPGKNLISELPKIKASVKNNLLEKIKA